jgi:DNA-binding Lrp family transcriptional regulator
MKIRRRYLFFILVLTSSIISAAVAAIDTTISARYISNPLHFSVSVFVVGIFVSFLIILIFSIPVGKKSLGSLIIDPSFRRVRLPRKEELGYHLLAGLGNTFLTLGYLSLLFLLGDPSTVLPFSQIAILYLVIMESFTEKNSPTLTEIQSSLIVTFGAILGSLSLTETINLPSLAIVFLVVNPAWVLFSVSQRKLKRMTIQDRPNDSLNIRCWNVVFSCLFTLLFLGMYDLVMHTGYVLGGLEASVAYFDWLSLTMGVTFFSFVFYIRALGIGKASVTQAVRSSLIIFAIPFSLFLAHFGIISPLPGDPVMILIKAIGTILVILGITSYALTLVKAYIFATIKPGYSIYDTMEKIWNIHGVARVTATTGANDFIIKIRVRALVKGYERIIRHLEKIEALQKFTWSSVLKEWEEL